MASKKNFLDTLLRLTFATDEVSFAAVAEHAAAQWAELKPEQRAALVHDDARCRIFAAGHAAGKAAGWNMTEFAKRLVPPGASDWRNQP